MSVLYFVIVLTTLDKKPPKTSRIAATGLAAIYAVDTAFLRGCNLAIIFLELSSIMLLLNTAVLM
nr:MAG TPA: hypothetical protein [Caudoviricetes sp.]